MQNQIWYKKWHENKFHGAVHWSFFVVFSIFLSIFILNEFNSVGTIDAAFTDANYRLFKTNHRATTPGKFSIATDIVEIDIGIIESGVSDIVLSLPDKSFVNLKKRSHKLITKSNAVWRGYVDKKQNSDVVLTLKNGFLAGIIRIDDSVYEIRPIPNNKYVFKKLDINSIPIDKHQVVGSLQTTENISQGSTSQASASNVVEIDLLSVYTPEARSEAGGRAQMDAIIQSAVDNANIVFENSQVNTRYNLIATAEVSHHDSGNISTDLNWLQADPGVAAVRNQYGADLVSLMVQNGAGWCGSAFAMRAVGPEFENLAFQVTDSSCSGTLAFTHEHGHNLGMEHDPQNGVLPQYASYPWSYGHYVNGSFRTVMSYPYPYNTECNLGCTLVPYFSNPNIYYNGSPLGMVDVRDNSRTANLTSSIVAAFRSRVDFTVAPAAPSNLNSTATPTTINLTWSDNSNNELGFKVERSSDGINFLEIANTGVNVNNYIDSSIEVNVIYSYRIKAYNNAGETISNILTATTPPITPSDLSSQATPTTINLTWSDNSNNELGFKVERSSDGINFSQIAQTQANIIIYSDSTVFPNVTYFYRVIAYNNSGNSSPSSSAVISLPCTRQNPTIIVSPVTTTKRSGQTAQYNVTITNNNSSNCLQTIYNLDATVPNGWVKSWSTGSVDLVSGASSSAILNITSLSTAINGTNTIIVQATDATVNTFTNNSQATYVVNNSTPPTVSVAVKYDKTRSNATANVTAIDDVAVKTINIWLDAGTSPVKTCSLRNPTTPGTCSFSIKLSSLSGTNHTFLANAIDTSGTNSITVTVGFSK